MNYSDEVAVRVKALELAVTCFCSGTKSSTASQLISIAKSFENYLFNKPQDQ